MPILLLFIGKIAIYAFWCWYGVRLLAPTRRDSAIVIGLGLAILRILVGLVVGSMWANAAGHGAPNEALSRVGFDQFVFIFGFLLLRLLQWCGISWLIALGTEHEALLWTSVQGWLWRFGGVGISLVGDVLGLILYLGLVGIIC